MIILFGGEKGGTGKTTLATNIAAMRTAENSDTLLIDADKQMTASYWCSLREDNKIRPRVTSVQKLGKSLRTEVGELSKKYADIIIDAGGKDAPELRAGLLVADLIIIPLRPSQFDLWTLAKLNELVSEVSDLNQNLLAYVVINQSSTNPSVNEARDAKELLNDFEYLDCFNTVICERIAFRRAAIQGSSVMEAENADKKSVAEITNLYQEIFYGKNTKDEFYETTINKQTERETC